jgi:hypothetical protein
MCVSLAVACKLHARACHLIPHPLKSLTLNVKPPRGRYQEKFYFSPGDTGFKVFDTKYGRMGAGICWDQWFPETARSMALMGAEILFYPTAIGSEPQDTGIDSYPHWTRTMLGHAAANLVRPPRFLLPAACSHPLLQTAALTHPIMPPPRVNHPPTPGARRGVQPHRQGGV